ncbi:alpha/beta hydrolase [Streptomyces iconiensis]|uniref:Prolyl oligopeptidase family serine peptidase n=1 Tax=Streptomyces iconiensis TaxID=1384038 RepID=A0ABT6ZWQ6_9ACTN|nr:prolyl oligopeptidase family serine peptidase [Streptomyces iconiensis]MDJ1133061.1 prolyl oligopeptidase family serine peptidase [Streptomyces iconiensis]
MRLRTAALTATSVLSAGAAVLAAGRYAADAALRPPRPRPHGGGQPPAGFQGTRLTVHSHGEGRVALTRSLAARLPGVYGLTGRGAHAAVGRVLEAEAEDAHVHVTVRELRRVSRGQLTVGGTVRLTPQVHVGDPGEALGMEYAEVEIPGELGSLPAWFVPGARATWVITAHGLGATREHPMVMFPFYQRHHLPVLDLAYRGDPGAPRPLDGISHLGDAEWRDLDAAIRYAVRHGARRVVLHGWSSGASMALHAAANSALRDRISGIVLDSPVLDWQRTLRALAGAHHVPRALLPLAVRAVQGRTGLSGGRLASVADPDRLTVPTLLLHGPDDHIAPWDGSRELADARKDLISLHTVPEAPHAAMWNADPQGYEEALRRFLTPLM